MKRYLFPRRKVQLCVSLMLCGLVILFFSLTAAAEEWPPPLGKKKIVYLVGPFDTSNSISNVGAILLRKMGYEVELQLLETGLVYEALATGTGDVWSTGYYPGQEPYLDKHYDKIFILGPSYGPVYDGMAVPSYMPVASIEDLKSPEVVKKLKGQIIGIDAGSGTMNTARKAMEAYGLGDQYELLPGSTPAMEASFKAAVAKKDWIVVIGWCPTAMCELYKPKFLGDPKNVFTDAKDFHVVRRGFMQDFPRASLFLSRLHLYDFEIEKIIVKIRVEGMEPEKAAQWFIDTHPELVWWWAGDLIPGMQEPESLKKK